MRVLWNRGLHVRVSIVGLLLIALLALLAPLVAPFDQNSPNIAERMQGPNIRHWFGTDQLGRDTLSRVIWGGRLSLTVGLIAIAVEFFFGVIIGLVSGYFGGFVDDLIQRVCDVMMAIPGIIMALFIVAIIGTGLTKVMVALGISGIPGIIRLVRGATMSVREQEYVLAAKAAGAKPHQIISWHVLPNVLPPILVLTTLSIGGIILAAASLSYIGLGAQPPSPEWGAMLTGARDYFRTAWWLSVFPGLFIMMVVLFVNIIGDNVRDMLDPWLRQMGS